MKISCLFPIFITDDAEKYFEKFLSSKFFNENKTMKIIVFVTKFDEKNKTSLENLSKQHKNFKLEIIQDNFNYNDAFLKATKVFDGDVLLLGDTKIDNIDLIFTKCLEKYRQGANIVFVKKKYGKFRQFFMNFLQSFYNFFIKILSNKRDRFNVISLGLYDKNVLDVFRELPDKCCFLKNTKDLFGFSSRTIYIDSKIQTLKQNFGKPTPSLISGIVTLSLFTCVIILTIILNSTMRASATLNIFAIFGSLFFLVLSMIFFPKHFCDIRNMTSKTRKK